jgi:hypothetical protein|tara:strand:- start:2601 stop:5063 length:2463 start_codon:yes stop_codon:yes gene_type:complete
MAIDKAQNPFLPELVGQAEEESIDIEIVNPEAVSIETEDGGVLIDFDPDNPLTGGMSHESNLALFMEERDLYELSSDLLGAYAADKDSRADWEDSYMKGLDLLGLKFEDRSVPWDGACGVFHPMLSEAVVRFQAQTIQEIYPASGPVKTRIVGKLSDEKTSQAHRVQNYLNYLITERMTEYRTETEKLLFSLPIAGSAFRKVYYDPNMARPCAMFVPAEDFVVSYGASDLTTCERATHVMKKTSNEIRKLQVSGFYLDVDLTAPTPDISNIQEKYNRLTGDSDNYEYDNRHTLLEMHVDVDLKGFEDTERGEPTGIGLPYVITIDKSSSQVLAIRRNWHEDDPKRLPRQHFVHYQYLPGFGFYGFGLVHMIGGLSKSATSLLRQLVDAGTLANLPGGLKARGLRIKGDDTPIMPGEFRDVDVPGGTIRDNITFLPYKEPSNVLYSLLADIVTEGRRFASAADVKASDINGEAPVGTTLAILEREMKVMSAVQARVHASVGKELKILSNIVRDNGPESYPYELSDDPLVSEDFDDRVDIIPVSDPNAGTMAQRIMQYQAALQLATTAPQMYDMPLLHRQMLEVLGIQDADKIVPLEDDMKPVDPISENMNIIMGEPVKAFIYQDHEAHIQIHMSATENPQILELMQKAPNAKAVEAELSAHIQEHLAFAYRQKIEEELGVALPPPNEALPEDIELRISRLVAPAAAQVTGKAQQMVQAEENAKRMQDPVVQMQQRELAIEEGKAMAKAQADMARIQLDLQKAQEKATLDREKIDSQERIESAKIGAKVASDAIRQEEIDSREAIEGAKMGMDLVKDLIEDE